MTEIETYKHIVDTYYVKLYKYCYTRLSFDFISAEETTDEVMLLLSQKWNSFQLGDEIGAWLYRAADQSICKMRESKARYYRRNLSFEEAVQQGALEITTAYDLTMRSTSERDIQLMKNITSALPEEYRNLYSDYFLTKMTIPEMVSKTGIPYSTIRFRLSKIEILVKNEIAKRRNF